MESFLAYPFSVPTCVSEVLRTSKKPFYSEVKWPPSDPTPSIKPYQTPLSKPPKSEAKANAKGFNFSKSLRGIKSEAGSAVLTPGDGAETIKVQDSSFGGMQAKVVHLAPHALSEGFAEKTLEKLDALSKGTPVPSKTPANNNKPLANKLSEGAGNTMENLASLFSSLGGATPPLKSAATPRQRQPPVTHDPQSLLFDVSGESEDSAAPHFSTTSRHPRSGTITDAGGRSSSSATAEDSSAGGAWGSDTSLVGALHGANRGACSFCGNSCRFTSFSSTSSSLPLGRAEDAVWPHSVREGADVSSAGGKSEKKGVASAEAPSPNPDAVQVVVTLPGHVTSAADVDFFLGLRSLEVSVKGAGKLKIPLPYSVAEDRCQAHFSKAKHRLTITTARARGEAV